MILLMFSGGLDSTGVFYKLIKEKEKLHVHHMNLINKENRCEAEKIAVKRICEYMKNIGEFDYSESTHEMPTINKSFAYDSDLYNLVAGSICSCNPKIKFVALGLTKSDLSSSVSNRITRGNKIFESFNTNAKKTYPLVDKTKKEIYDNLPKELINLTWSCRTPIYNNGIHKCGKCKSCKEFNFPISQ